MNIKLLMAGLDAEGLIVFQGVLMAGYSPRQAILNAYGVCKSHELTQSPFAEAMVRQCVPQWVADIVFLASEKEIEEAFWEVANGSV